MRQIILGMAIFSSLLFGWAGEAAAQIFECTDWDCTLNTDPLTGGTSQSCYGVPEGCDDIAFCDNNPQECDNDDPIVCGPGTYACNRGCCSVATGEVCQCGVNASGACKPCDGGGECRVGYAVNCASPAQVIWQQPVYDFCFRDDCRVNLRFARAD